MLFLQKVNRNGTYTVMTRDIIWRMIRIYEMYRATKFVGECDDRILNDITANKLDDELSRGENVFVPAGDVIKGLAPKRFLLVKKFGKSRAMRAIGAAADNGYLLEKTDGDKIKLTVTNEKGIHFIDGLPFLRVGLWKAWHDEYGGLFTFLTSGAVVAAFLFLAKFVWHSV